MRLTRKPALNGGRGEHHAASDTLDGDLAALDEGVDGRRAQADDLRQLLDRDQPLHVPSIGPPSRVHSLSVFALRPFQLVVG